MIHLTEALTLLIGNILLISLPLALFEIVAEKDKGWGSGWKQDTWYARPFFPRSALMRFWSYAGNVQSPLGYHVVVFGLLLPITFIAQYLTITQNAALLFSSFIATLLFEDFFWFALNWHLDSRRELLRGPHGKIWWHKKWIQLPKGLYLPASYRGSLILILVFFAIAVLWH